MFRTIDRYLAREILVPLILSLLVFTFILEIPPVMEQAEGLIAKGVPLDTIARIMLTLLPQALGLTIPMAVLIGLLVGLGRLSGDRETVALQACGVSLFRLLRPVAVLAVLAWAATSYVFIEALPDANQTFREITYNIVAQRAEHDVKPRVFFEDFPNRVLYVRDVPHEGAGWNDVLLADTQNAAQPDIFLARRGRMVLDRAARRVTLVLENGTRHRTASQPSQDYEVLHFEQMAINLDPDAVFPRTGLQRGENESTVAELRDQANELRRQGLSPHRPLMAIQRKFSIPVACLVFALIGLALGVTSRNDGKLASFVQGIGVIFVYYIIMYLGEAMAKAALVPAQLAMWLPNIFLGAAGVVLLLWRARSVERGVSLAIPLPFRGRGAQSTTPLTPAARGTGSVAIVVRFPQFWIPRPNILDWYITRIYMRTFGLSFVGMLGIFYISTFIDLSDKLFKGQATGRMLIDYFVWATPQFTYYVTPIAALVTTLVTIGLLTKNSELVVMRACGISLYRSAMPLLLFGLMWSGGLFGLEETVLATANRRAEALRHVIRGGSPMTFDVLNRKWIVARDGNVYHYAFYDPRQKVLNGLSVYELDQKTWRMTQRTFATVVAYTGRWHARQGWVRMFGPEASDPPTYEAFDRRAMNLEPPEYFVTEQPDAERMSYKQLRRYITELRASGFNVVPYAVALYAKLSFPFVTLIMTLIAVPFAVTTGRQGALYGIGVGIVLALGYWIIMRLFVAIGGAGLIAPMLAAWAPNIMFTACAAYLLLTART